ncbi:MAG: zinc-dependent peptidase [Burkholderiales bacterium]|nr:zinc-dependent peptidase [Burkholderiales bacterium]
MGLGHWFGRWRRARAVERQPIDDAQWLRMMSRFSFFRLLSAGEQRRLRELTALFLDRKPVSGAGGLEMTREMQLIIAAQACLLVLNLDLDLYDDWVEVIVYPDEFVVEHDYMDEDGVMHKVRAPLSGEAWEHGPVILSWRDAQEADGGDGYNVVLHEFAHKIDMRNGSANGFPPLHADMDRQVWSEAFGAAFADFGRRLDEREEPPLDEYAAEDPAEFFAVTSELFFERPDALHGLYPAVYDQLAQFYRQNPLVRMHPAGIKPS